MKIRSIEISNILSIQDIKLNFGDSGLVLLDGWNYDDDTANGAGKTAIFNSIAYGLYGKFPRKISAADILRDDAKSGYVRIILEVDNHLIEVCRARPNNLKFSINGVEKSLTQEEFEARIRLTYDQYLISMYSAQTEGLKLISLNDTSKKDFFLQLMNFDSFAACKKEVDNVLKTLTESKRTIENEVEILKSRGSAYQESLVNVASIKCEIDQQDPSVLIGKLKKLETIGPPDTKKFDDLENKLNSELYSIRQGNLDLDKKHIELAKLKKRIAKLKMPIAAEVCCPECNTPIILGNGDIRSLSSIEVERKQELLETIIEYKDLSDEVKLTENSANREQQIESLMQDCKKQKSVVLEEFSLLKQSIASLKSDISYRKMNIDKLQSSIDKNTILEKKIAVNFESVVANLTEIATLQTEIELYETISQMYSPTGAPAYVLDSTIDIFNDKVQQYVSMVWPNASYTLQSFKENKSGDIKAKFSELLTIAGREKSIGALSGGEHRCLSLAIDFAVIDVLETMFNIYMSPIMLDEPFNALDAANRERVLDLLDKLSINRQIWIVDHASEVKTVFSNTIRVEKRSGISSLA